MQITLDISNMVLPVFLIVGLGFALKQTSLFEDTFLYQINHLVYFQALSSLFFIKSPLQIFLPAFTSYLLYVWKFRR